MSAETAVAEFGRLHGLDDLSLHPAGHVRLGLPSGDWLAFDLGRGHLALSLVARVPFVPASALMQALQTCDLRRDSGRLPVRVGLHGQGEEACLVMAVQLPEQHGLSGQDLMQAAERLLQWHGRWRDGAAGL